MRLILMRHATAATEEGRPDHDRPLTEQGVRDARTMGRWLRAQEMTPEVVWCSSALRARQTWSAIAAVLTDPPAQAEPSYLRSVYQAGPADLIDLLRDIPSSVESVLVVGHNPTLQQAVAALTGENNDFPAGAVAVLDADGAWSAPTSWRLFQLTTPKDA